MTINCKEAIEFHGLPLDVCCDHCHSEEADGFDNWYCEYPIGDKYYLTCCRVMRALEDKGIK